MKKFVAILLMAAVMAMAITGLAEKIDFEIEKNITDFAQEGVKAGSSSENTTQIDMVVINGSQYAVLTGEFVGIAYTAPTKYVYVLTQDYLHQKDTFDSFYNNNGLEAALSFVDKGIHMNMYDAVNGIDIYVQIISSNLGEYFPDADNMTEAEIQYVLQYFLGAGFSEQDDPTYKKIGGNHYFFFDCSDTEQRVYMYTMKGGKVISIQYNADSAEMVARGIELLESLTISSLKFVES